MAVARIGAGAGGSNTTGAAVTFNGPSISSSNANTVALVGVVISVSSNSTSTTCAVTYGGVAMTQLSLTLVGSTTSRAAVGLYYLYNPGASTASVVVTPGGSSTKASVNCQAVAFSGVNVAMGSAQTSAATTHAPTSVNAGYDVRVLSNGATLSAPNQTQEYLGGSATPGGVGKFMAMQSAAGTGSTVSFTCTGTATTPESVAVALSPAPISDGTSTAATAGLTAAGTRAASGGASTTATAGLTADGFVTQPIALLTDNFATQDATKWTFDGSAAATGGQLVETPDPTAANVIVSVQAYNITNSAMYIELVQPPAAATSMYAPFRLLSPDFASYIEWNYQANIIQSAVIVNNSFVTSANATYDPVNHKWLRIRHNSGDGQIHWDTSPDGNTWNNDTVAAWTVSGLVLTNLTVYVYGGVSAGSVTANAIWDNFNVTPQVLSDGTSTAVTAALSGNGFGGRSDGASRSVTAGLAAGGVRNVFDGTATAVTASRAVDGVRAVFDGAALSAASGLTVGGFAGRSDGVNTASAASLTANGLLAIVGGGNATVAAGLTAGGVRAASDGANTAVTAGLTSGGVWAESSGTTTAVTAGLSADGVRGISEGVSLASAAGLTANGVLAVSDGVNTVGSASVSAGGVRAVFDAVSAAVAAGLVSGGFVGRSDGASLPVAVVLTADGAISGGGLGSADSAFVAALTAGGVLSAFDGVNASVAAGLTAGGGRGVFEGAALASAAGLTAGGLRGVPDGAFRAVAAGLAADGFVARTGSASLQATVALTAGGLSGDFVGADLSVAAVLAADGRVTLGVIDVPPGNIIVVRAPAQSVRVPAESRSMSVRKLSLVGAVTSESRVFRVRRFDVNQG